MKRAYMLVRIDIIDAQKPAIVTAYRHYYLNAASQYVWTCALQDNYANLLGAGIIRNNGRVLNLLEHHTDFKTLLDVMGRLAQVQSVGRWGRENEEVTLRWTQEESFHGRLVRWNERGRVWRYVWWMIVYVDVA